MKNFLTSLSRGKKILLILLLPFLLVIFGGYLVLWNNTRNVEKQFIEEIDLIIEAAGLEPTQEHSTNGNAQCLDVCFSVSKQIDADSNNFDEIIENLSENNRSVFDKYLSDDDEFYSVESSVCDARIGYKSAFNLYIVACHKNESFRGA